MIFNWKKEVNILFYGLNGSDTCDYGIFIGSAPQTMIRDCEFGYFDNAANTSKAIYNSTFQIKYENIYTFYCDFSIYSVTNTNSYFNNLKFYQPDSIPLYLNYCWGTEVSVLDITAGDYKGPAIKLRWPLSIKFDGIR